MRFNAVILQVFMKKLHFHTIMKSTIVLFVAFGTINSYGCEYDENSDLIDTHTLVALKSNLIHDALITPDIGIEVSLSPTVSIGIEGVYAWWSNDNAHRYWRIRGGWIDASWWFGELSNNRRLTGHHLGVYTSLHDYDFEFGGKGWQSNGPTYGVGVKYGYSFHLNKRLNLDLCVRVGYSGGRVTEYKPLCGTYMCVGQRHVGNIGLTGLGITLVWFPGSGNSNNPSR